MKAVVISDLHIHNYKTFDKNGSRLENCLRLIDETYSLCISRGINVVLMCGDLYDQQKALPTVVVNEVIKRLSGWIKQHGDIVWYAITGNHDQASKSLDNKAAVSALEHLAEVFPYNFILIDNASIDIDEACCKVVGIPYYEYSEHYSNMLDNAVKLRQTDIYGDVKTILMVHQTPSGLGNPNIPVDTEIEDSRYGMFDLVLCGHIHKRQQLAANFYVVGSPIHRDLGDQGEEKGVLIIDLDNPAKNIEFVSWADKFPMFKTVMEGQVEESDDYVVVKPSLVSISVEEQDVADKFAASNKSSELIENYWQHVDGEDKELLSVGLSLL